FSLLTYEVGYPLVIVSPLILLWLEGKVTKRVVRLAAVWYSVVLLCAIWGIVQFREVPRAMQNHLLASNELFTPADNFRAITDAFLRAYTQNFFTSWKEAISALPSSPYILSGIFIASVVGFVTWHFTQPKLEKTRKNRFNELFALILAGLAIIGLG